MLPVFTGVNDDDVMIDKLEDLLNSPLVPLPGRPRHQVSPIDTSIYTPDVRYCPADIALG